MILDRAGIFKATLSGWRVKRFDNSNSVAIGIDFVIQAQLDGSEWIDWSMYEPTYVSGDFWVVKKDGRPSITTVQTLSQVLGWTGSLQDVARKMPPDVVVQVTVNPEEYNGKTYYKVSWLNSEDWTPNQRGASEDDVKALDQRFGSLLRAAAGGGGKTPPPKSAASKTKPQPAEPNPEPNPEPQPDYGEIPF